MVTESKTGAVKYKIVFPASKEKIKEVYVTGSFNDWSVKVPLKKCSDKSFQATVELPISSEEEDKSYTFEYKFIVDGAWKVDDSKPVCPDGFGNLNNVLTLNESKKKPGLLRRLSLLFKKEKVEANSMQAV